MPIGPIRSAVESALTASPTFVDWLAARKGGIAITGASGWIGSAMTQFVLAALPDGAAPPLRLFGSAARPLRIAGRTLAVEPLSGARLSGDGEWLVIHLAVAGADRGGDAEQVRAVNDRLLAEAMALADGAPVRRFVYASSGAVHQRGGGPDRQAYGELKRVQEAAVRAWSAGGGPPVLIPRIFNLGGPFINHWDRYALSSFIDQAQTQGVIRIAARRPVIRSYVHVHEFARVVLDAALGGDRIATFETAGAAEVEMGDLAEAVRRVLEAPDVGIVRDPLDSDQPDRYVGDGDAYLAALAASGASPTGLDRIIADTAASMRRVRA